MFPHSDLVLRFPPVLQDHHHLLTPPPYFASFIPLPDLSISALVNFTVLPGFDPTLAGVDVHQFFSSIECTTRDVASDFLERSIPPLALSSRLLDEFNQALLDGAKSVCDPRFSGNLPCWVLTYWHNLGHAVASKEKWSMACHWLAQRGHDSGDEELSLAVNETSCALQTLGWNMDLRGPVAFLQTSDPANFLASTPMKGRFVDAMVNGISHQIQLDSQLRKSTVVEELTFASTLRYDSKRWSQYMFDRGFTRLRQLGDSLSNEELEYIIFPIDINGAHWTVFLVDVKAGEICYGDSLDWPWPKTDVDRIQQWLREHGFRTFSKGAILPHGRQQDAYSCAITMINTIRHKLYGTPLFTNEKRDLLRIQELIFLLRAHFSEDESKAASDYSPSSPTSSLASFQSRSPSPTSSLISFRSHSPSAAPVVPPVQSPIGADIPQPRVMTSHPKITLNYRISSSEPKTGLLKHFKIVSREDYLADIHQRDLVCQDKQHDDNFSAALNEAERKHEKRLYDRDRQRAHRARTKEVCLMLMSLIKYGC
jgi:hypothetical protein